MQIEDRLEAFFTTMNNYENIFKVVLYTGVILIAYNYFFYVSLVGLAIGIPLYYIRTRRIRSIKDFRTQMFPVTNTVINSEPRPTLQVPA